MNSATPKVFRYADGTVVMEGDRVKPPNVLTGVILSVIQPGSSDAEAYGCPDGGVLIEENWNGTPSLLLLEPPDGEQWEDLEFISRAPFAG
jgi:hypothetical protein